ISLTCVMMQDLGISNPDRHIILLRDVAGSVDRTPATFLFKRSEFTQVEVQQVEIIAKQNNFQILYTPLTRPDNVFTQMITAEDTATVWNNFPTNVQPTYDNNPFFFNSLRLANLGGAISSSYEWRKTNLGTFVLFTLFVITTVLVVLFILGPLVLVRKRASGKGTVRLSFLFYFASLGGGF